MRDEKNTCTACFPDGSRTECRVFDHSSGALTIYSSLHATGRFAAMCLQADNRYRVCHAPGADAAMHPLLRARAA
ncbi:MAG: hypothetical protein HYU78_10020 [Rhodocyclales bacterium]|nr:hypothetical protein [Rhodocyclales bacterium]